MENKKKKGFTLIELLAIIVILAIIAVITVPIILNIIDNSRKGAVIDSAHGYKDAVNKAYVTKLSENKELKLNGTYTVGSDGTLTGNFNNPEITSLPVDVSGTVPTGGTLTYSNNILTGGYLIIEDYRATFNSDGTVTVEKNTPGEAIVEPTTRPMAYATKNSTITIDATEIATGSYVIIGDEGFYAMSEPSSNGIVRLLPEYNISNTGTSESLAYRQDSSNDFEKIKFSTSKYWENCVATSSESKPTCSNPYRPSEIDIELGEKSAMSGHIYFMYGYVYDSNSNLYNPINNYKKYLETMVGSNNIIKARPVSNIEMDKQLNYGGVWSQNQEYWLGTVENNALWDDNGDSSTPIPGNAQYLDISANEIYQKVKESDENKTSGIRPVIEVSTSIFEQGGITKKVKPVIYASKGDTSTKELANMAVGDYVTIADDGFYVINPNQDGNVLLLAEYNISNTPAQTGYNAPSDNGITLMSNKINLVDNTTETYRQTSGDNYKKMAFSAGRYWYKCVATESEPEGSCDTIYRQKYSGEKYGYVYDSNSNLYTPMENYKDYLETITGLTLTARPMSISEAESIISYSWAYTQNYWLGSEIDHDSVWYAVSGGLSYNYFGNYYNSGIRPLIEIPISAFNK